MDTRHIGRSGFSLIEILVVLTIVAILAALGLPAMQDQIRNAQLRSQIESFQFAVKRARIEAINRNSYVELVLTADADTSPAALATVAPSLTGNNWLIRERSTPCVPGAPVFTYIEGKNRGESGVNPIFVRTSVSNICIDGMGRANAPLTVIAADTDAAAAVANCVTGSGVIQSPASVCLIVDRGGSGRFCLPGAVTGSQNAC